MFADRLDALDVVNHHQVGTELVDGRGDVLERERWRKQTRVA